MVKTKNMNSSPALVEGPSKQKLEPNGGTEWQSIEVDVDLYQSYLDDTSLTPEEKTAYLEALWFVLVGFIELGFGVHPLQQACGQSQETSSPEKIPPSDKIKSKTHAFADDFFSAVAAKRGQQ